MFLLPFSAVILLSAGAAPDFYFEQTTVTLVDGVATGPGVASRVWHGDRKMRLESGDAPGGPAFILRLDTGKAYRLDPARRTATVLDAEDLRTRSQRDLQAAGSVLQSEEAGSARTTPLRAPKTLAGYPCRGYRITAGSTQVDLYVSSRIPVGIGRFADFLEWTGAEQALGAVLSEIRKLPGFPLETRTRVTVGSEVQETVATVTRIRVGAHALSLFDPPLDYELEREDEDEEEN